jgi:hypothetical protein
MATNTYVALDKVTVGTATPSITFSSIPQGYTDLVVVMSPATTHTLATFPYMRFNSDSGSNYSYTEVNGNGTSATSFRDVNQTIGWTSPQMASISNTLGDNTTIANIMNYSNATTYKTYLSRANRAGSTLDYQGVEAAVGLWRSTAAITSVLIGNRRGGVDYNFAVGSTFSLYGIRAEGAAFARGGIVTSDANYYYHTFLASGTFTPVSNITTEVLVVAGGGSQGAFYGAGGGAGGLRGLSAQSMTSGTAYTVTVGGGGASTGASTSSRGNNGTNSSISGTGFSTITASGGGGGAGAYTGLPFAGGSGGGGNTYSGIMAGGAGNAGGYTPVEGYAGEQGNSASPNFGGAGGGAGQAGGTNGSGIGGDGSSAYSAWGLATGTGENVSGTIYYAGGGSGNTPPKAGGKGGGGDNTARNGFSAWVGHTNTGGGSGSAADNNGYAGGSGIVIIRYLKA